MQFPAFGDFVLYLESIGELQRVTREVDPYLEITEIATRALHEQKPALLFENVKGAQYPLAINVYASDKRIEYALGRHPEEIGQELYNCVEQCIPPTLSSLWNNRSIISRALRAKPCTVSRGISQEIELQPNLDDLPIQTCWPDDGGRFITQAQVFTYDPIDGKRNVGLYRLQVYDKQTTGMHWQIQKGGGFHYHRAEKMNEALKVAVAFGTDPALLLSTVSALPEGIDEVMFASFLRGGKNTMTHGRSINLMVPANAEFILEGIVPPKQRRIEGPFGDHFGHYSQASPFPVFHIHTMTHRRNPIYPATVVGIPPMEDKYLGDASQQILAPLLRLLHKEIRNMWAYYESGFHNLLVVSIETRYKKEAMKTAFGLLGTGQLSLTKCMVLVSENTDPRDWSSVIKEIHDNFDPHFDFVLLPNVPLDTLDFTSYAMELGSRMIIDATRKNRVFEDKKERIHKLSPSAIRSFDNRIMDSTVINDCLLIIKVQKNGRAVIEKLVKKKELSHLKIVTAVSEDVDLKKQESYIWGIFTRFDCARDVFFTEQKLKGISPVYSGVMGIDATWKKGYPAPLAMDPIITKRVDAKWEGLWK